MTGPTPPSASGGSPPAPHLALVPGTTFALGLRDEATLREIIFEKRYPRHGSTPSKLLFHDGQGSPIFLTDAEIQHLCRTGRFRPSRDADGAPTRGCRPLLSLSDEERARCERKKAYVDAVLALGEPRCRQGFWATREIAAQAARFGELPKAWTTVRDWIDLWRLDGEQFGIACFARRVAERSEKPSATEEAVRFGITQVLIRGEATADQALEKAREWMVLTGREEAFGDLPSLRTFQRRLAAVPRSVRLEGQYGRHFAEKETRIFYERGRPDLPLEEVEVDHTPLDLLAMNDDLTTILGRPDVISFRDRHSGCCLGLSIGFEAPSYASFLDGLRHAIYPKDEAMANYPEIERPWFCWGRFRRLYVDNALHFLCGNIQAAASELTFQLAECRPGNPWLKGAQEKMFHDLSMQVVNLPGATYNNILARRDRREIAQFPVLTLREIRAYLFKWICDDYHVGEREGLGFLRTMKGVPRAIWDRGVEKVTIPLPPEESVFVALAGDRHARAITSHGVRLDHIRYGSGAIEAIRNNSRHRNGRDDGLVTGTKHQGSRYVVTRDPFDLSHIYVRDPYSAGQPVIKVPAMRQDYAKGLTLHQHLVHVSNARKEVLEDLARDPVDELMRAKKRVENAVSLLQETRKGQQVERRLARYLWGGQKRAERSIVTTRPVDGEASAGSLLGNASRATSDRARGVIAGPSTPVGTSTGAAGVATDSFEDACARYDASSIAPFEEDGLDGGDLHAAARRHAADESRGDAAAAVDPSDDRADAAPDDAPDRTGGNAGSIEGHFPPAG